MCVSWMCVSSRGISWTPVSLWSNKIVSSHETLLLETGHLLITFLQSQDYLPTRRNGAWCPVLSTAYTTQLIILCGIPHSAVALSTGASSQHGVWEQQPHVCISSRHFFCLVSDTHNCTGNLSNHFWIKLLECCTSERCTQPSICSNRHLCIFTWFRLSQHHSLSPTSNLPMLMNQYSVYV